MPIDPLSNYEPKKESNKVDVIKEVGKIIDETKSEIEGCLSEAKLEKEELQIKVGTEEYSLGKVLQNELTIVEKESQLKLLNYLTSKILNLISKE